MTVSCDSGIWVAENGISNPALFKRPETFYSSILEYRLPTWKTCLTKTHDLKQPRKRCAHSALNRQCSLYKDHQGLERATPGPE